MKLIRLLEVTVKYGVPALALFFITVCILHEYNPGMMFLTNNTSLFLLMVFCILGIAGFFLREPKKRE